MANTTLSSLRSFGRKTFKIDRLWKVWDDSEWNDAIWGAIEEVQNYGNFRLQENNATTTFNTVVDQAEYDISTSITDLQGINVVEFDNVTLDTITYEDVIMDNETIPTGTPTNYYIYNNKIGLYPTPSVVDTVTVVYNKKLTLPTDDADESPLSSEYDRAIILYAQYTLLSDLWDPKNVQRASLRLQRFNKELGKLYNMDMLLDRNQLQYKNSYTPNVQLYKRNRFITYKICH